MVRREAAYRTGKPLWFGVLTVVLLYAIFSFLTPFTPDAEEMNVIKSITTVADPSPGVEIVLYSSVERFSMRALPYVLRIGTKEFTRSRYPTVSTLEQAQEQQHTLIFFLPAQDFADLSTGDPMTVSYGHAAGSNQGNFGTLDKAIVDE